jgi:2-polyprenyl-6-methoxyphenol hydroxylase-like FAD-dependent oxidoreductase
MKKQVLISGASIAGFSAAYWMCGLGYEVTILEIAGCPRTGGSPVDVRGAALDVAKRMGIFEQLKARRLEMSSVEFKNSDDVTEGSMLLKHVGAQQPDDDIEIGRNDLVDVLHNAVRSQVKFLFKDSIKSLSQNNENIMVTFTNSYETRIFDLLIGCDGLHSNVRKLVFGKETDYVHYLGQYFSISGVNKQLIKDSTGQLYNVPGKACTLYAYNGKTDVIFAFLSEKEIAYDYRDIKEQKRIIIERFEGGSWRTGELLEEMKQAESFYFDKLCQVKMPAWTKGRVVLVGDAGYCASPASGMGASLSLVGAAALADALMEADGDLLIAFKKYNHALRPFVEELQATALIGLEFLVPKTKEAIKARNAQKAVITSKG